MTVASDPVKALTVRRTTAPSAVASSILALVVVGLFLLPYVRPIGAVHELVNLFVYMLLALMWNLLAGFGGMVSVGQQAYLGLGAYGIVVLADHLGVDPFVSVLLAALIGAVVAVPISLLAFRLVGAYFAIGTWVIAEAVRLTTVQSATLGSGSGTSLHALSNLQPTVRVALTYWWSLGSLAVAVLGSYLLLRSRLGLALTAIRDDPVAAASCGVPVTRVKRLIFVVSAAGCSTAGALVALNSLQVQPDAVYGVQWSAYMIFMVVIGGIGSLEGALLGAIVFYALQQWLTGTTYLITLGLASIVVVLFARHGLWGLLSWRGRWWVFAVGHRVTGHSEKQKGSSRP